MQPVHTLVNFLVRRFTTTEVVSPQVASDMSDVLACVVRGVAPPKLVIPICAATFESVLPICAATLEGVRVGKDRFKVANLMGRECMGKQLWLPEVVEI